jgi:hypothetical protein
MSTWMRFVSSPDNFTMISLVADSAETMLLDGSDSLIFMAMRISAFFIILSIKFD